MTMLYVSYGLAVPLEMQAWINPPQIQSVSKETCMGTFILALFIKEWRLHCPPTGEQINNLLYIHTTENSTIFKMNTLYIYVYQDEWISKR